MNASLGMSQIRNLPLSMVLVLGGAIAAPAQPSTQPSTQPIAQGIDTLAPAPQSQVLPPAAADLKPFNPDLQILDVPTRPEAVTIDAQLNQAITLEQALDLARRNNRDLQVAELELRQQQAALTEAKAALLPTVNSQASLSRSDSATANIGLQGNPNASSISNSFNTSVQLDYDVFTSGQRPASIRAAESAIKASEKALEAELQQLRQDVANDYYDMQQAGALVGIAQAAVENARLTLNNAQALEEAGLGTRFDVLNAEVQLANQQQQLSQVQGQNQTTQRQLAQRLSLPPTANLSAADPVKIVGWWPLSLPESIVLAQQNRSELGELLDQRQIAQQNQRLILGSFGPQFSVSASGTFAADISQPDAAFGYSLGGQVSKTLFDGGATRANADQQVLNVKIAETQFANTRNLVRFQIEQNYFTLQTSFKNIDTNECAVLQANRSLGLARLRQQAGIGTQLEISNAQTDLTRAQSNRLQAIIDYNRSLTALERFVGHRFQQVKTGEIENRDIQELCPTAQS